MASPHMHVRIVTRSPSREEIQVVYRRWLEMKKELGEDVTASDVKTELIPLVMRLYQFEVL